MVRNGFALHCVDLVLSNYEHLSIIILLSEANFFNGLSHIELGVAQLIWPF